MLCSVMSSPSPTVLLDLDGTLIDSQPGILSSCRAALRALGHEPEASFDISAIIGPPMDDVMRVLLEPYGDNRIADAVAAYRADYGQNGLFNSLPYPGMNRALAEMQGTGARLYVATSKQTRFAQQILVHLDLAIFFDGIYGSETGGALDHKPELISHILERHGLSQRHCVMVGDRCYDIVGAHANKMRGLGVLWGYGTREELEIAGADSIVSEPESLAAAALAMATSDMHRPP